MNRLAEDVFQIPLMPRDAVNAYVLGDVLVDAGYSLQGGKVVGAVRGRPISAHVLTHAHVDHAGGSKRVCDRLGLEVWCGAADAAAVRTGRPVTADAGLLSPVLGMYARFPASPVGRELHEGDEIGPGFVVLDVPGHSPGHIALWREPDRVLVCGDVYFNMHLLTTAPGLHEPPAIFTPDVARNRASAKRLAALEPELAVFGHGPPLRDPAKLKAFADALPA
jgi:glyoxylase-like metal-dependent hydrolase (beta-lactamase superfamily II)